MNDLQQNAFRRNKQTDGLTQSSSKVPNTRSDNGEINQNQVIQKLPP